MSLRRPTATDQVLAGFGRWLREAADPRPAQRAYPARTEEDALSAAERRRAAGLMRINHAGEVAAQGLYHGQALTARSPTVREHLQAAAAEELDHMRWCDQRLRELGSQPSLLTPAWYLGSLGIGAVAGLAGDRWNLGFVAETEAQVSAHLDEHLADLPPGDQRSREVVATMRADEARHGAEAMDAGGAPLPGPVRALMRRVASVMKVAAYHV